MKTTNYLDIIGAKFGQLTVTKYLGKVVGAGNKSRWMYSVVCDCGKEKTVERHSLLCKNSTTCGCGTVRAVKKQFTTHGLSKHRLYVTYKSIIQRCEYPKAVRYKSYGGRGIKMCESWRSDFLNFYNWSINNGWKEGLTIDRINVDGNYEPENCRWVDVATQANNKKRNLYLNYKGETKTLAQWSSELNLNYSAVLQRIKKLKWTVEKAFETPCQ